MRNGCYSASEEPSAYGVCSISCGCNGDNDGIAGFGSERPVELGYPERERNGLPGELRGKRERTMILRRGAKEIQFSYSLAYGHWSPTG